MKNVVLALALLGTATAAAKSIQSGVRKHLEDTRSPPSGCENHADVTMETDAIVVGAGLSGLIAARTLEAEGKTVKVLEAMDRIGGRMYGEEVAANQFTDFGGQWVGETHDELKKLLKTLGIGLFLAPAPYVAGNQGSDKSGLLWGNKLYNTNGMASAFAYLNEEEKFTGSIVTDERVFAELVAQGISQSDLSNAIEAWTKFIKLAEEVFPNGGGGYYPTIVSDPKHKKLDELTMGEWIRSNTNSELARYLIGNYVRLNGAAGPSEASETSVLHKLWCVRNFFRSPEKYLIHGKCGAGQVPALLAKELKNDVATGDPVVAIEQTQDKAIVRTLSGKSFSATQGVIVAMPPAIANRINFNPPLSAARHQLAQHMPMGTVAKVLISYSRPFWRDKNLTGFGASDQSSGNMFTVMADSSDPDSGKGVIVALIAARQYDVLSAIEPSADGALLGLSSSDKRKRAVLSEVAKFLGPEALDCETFRIADWPSLPSVQGSYSAYMTPTGWTRFGHAIAESHGLVHWAGTDMSSKWPGYLEGAIVSGQRAAKALIVSGQRAHTEP